MTTPAPLTTLPANLLAGGTDPLLTGEHER